MYYVLTNRTGNRIGTLGKKKYNSFLSVNIQDALRCTEREM